MRTQREKILEHLKSGLSITPLGALMEFGCFRLGARIWDLREQGYNIKTTTIVVDDKHFASYSLERGNNVKCDIHHIHS